MKKYLAIILSVLMLVLFVSCDNDTGTVEDTTVEDTTVEETSAEDTTVEDTTVEDTTVEDTTVEDTTVEDTTVEETTAEDTAAEDTTVEDTTVEDTAAEDTTVDDMDFSDVDADLEDMTIETIPSNNNDGYSILRMHDQHSSIPQNHMTLLPSKQIGIHFTVDKGILEAVVLEGVPSWGNNIGGFTVKIFKWDTDYKTTVAGEPVAEQVLDNIPDMGEAVFTLDNKVGAGEYLFLICDPFDESGSGIGICNQTSNVNDDRFIEGFINGKANAKVGPTGYFVIYVPAE